MISMYLFLAAFSFSITGLIFYYFGKVKAFLKPSIISMIVSALIFITASIIPYSLQMQDQYNIAFAESNIVLYQGLIKDYTDAAQKQISDYQKMQSEMSRMATSIQLQYYSQQVDVVGNKLTDQIKSYNDNIIKYKIEINKSKVRMEYRPKNKWVFGL